MTLKLKDAYALYFKGIFGLNKIRELIHTGQIKTINIPSRHYYLDSEEIERFLREGVRPIEESEPQKEELGKVRKLKG